MKQREIVGREKLDHSLSRGRRAKRLRGGLVAVKPAFGRVRSGDRISDHALCPLHEFANCTGADQVEIESDTTGDETRRTCPPCPFLEFHDAGVMQLLWRSRQIGLFAMSKERQFPH